MILKKNPHYTLYNGIPQLQNWHLKKRNEYRDKNTLLRIMYGLITGCKN